MVEDSEIQIELKALNAVLKALAPLDHTTRRRVVMYVRQRFDLPEESPTVTAPPLTTDAEVGANETAAVPSDAVTDIRTLKEQKQPKTAVEMAVLVGYYVREVAPAAERRDTIGTDEIDRYFKQADYPLPSVPRNVLMFAKNAGYLDSHSRGQYSLNPVGYNLVAHGLPRSEGEKPRKARAKPRAKARPKKTAVRVQPRKNKPIASKPKKS